MNLRIAKDCGTFRLSKFTCPAILLPAIFISIALITQVLNQVDSFNDNVICKYACYKLKHKQLNSYTFFAVVEFNKIICVSPWLFW